jgi:hypothetical protein
MSGAISLCARVAVDEPPIALTPLTGVCSAADALAVSGPDAGRASPHRNPTLSTAERNDDRY